VRPSPKSAGRIFTGAAEAMLAAEHDVIDLHTRILVRLPDPSIEDAPGRQGYQQEASAPCGAGRRVETTLGRLLFNETLPEDRRCRTYTRPKDSVTQPVAACAR